MEGYMSNTTEGAGFDIFAGIKNNSESAQTPIDGKKALDVAKVFVDNSILAQNLVNSGIGVGDVFDIRAHMTVGDDGAIKFDVNRWSAFHYVAEESILSAYDPTNNNAEFNNADMHVAPREALENAFQVVRQAVGNDNKYNNMMTQLAYVRAQTKAELMNIINEANTRENAVKIVDVVEIKLPDLAKLLSQSIDQLKVMAHNAAISVNEAVDKARKLGDVQSPTRAELLTQVQRSAATILNQLNLTASMQRQFASLGIQITN